jgi:hypothetical protein
MKKLDKKLRLFLFLLLSLVLACSTNLNANSKSNLKSVSILFNNSKINHHYSNKTLQQGTTYFKSTLESNKSFLFIQEIKIEEVEEFEENLVHNKSKYFLAKNNTSFFYKNLIENNLLSIKEEVLFQNFITTSSFIRLYKRFQVYII